MKSKPKGKFHKYSDESLKKAVEDVRNGAQLRDTCRKYGVPKSTVQDRIKGKVDDLKKAMGPDPVLTKQNEHKLVIWIENLAKCGFPIQKKVLLDTVQKIVLEEKLNTPFTNGRPGQSWYSGFMKRHSHLALKNAESLEKYRAQITEEYIRSWFMDLKTFLCEHNVEDILEDPSRILNGDESGFSLCPKTGRVIGIKGCDLNIVKTGNSKENLTALVTFTADGRLCPPLVIFPYVRPPKCLVDNMPPEWILGKSDSGWMRSDVFFEYVVNGLNKWLEKEDIKKPVLFLVDGHRSHMSLELSSFCHQNGIILFALPPNATHLLQPADVAVFKPLKEYWREEVRKWQSHNDSRVVTKIEFCPIFKKALDNPKMSDNMKNGFKACGIYPFNPDAVNYKKCVQNVLEQFSQSEINENKITESDIAATEKVLLKLKPKLSELGICTETILSLLESLIQNEALTKNNQNNNADFTYEEINEMEIVLVDAIDGTVSMDTENDTSDNSNKIVILQDILLNNTESLRICTKLPNESNPNMDTEENIHKMVESEPGSGNQKTDITKTTDNFAVIQKEEENKITVDKEDESQNQTKDGSNLESKNQLKDDNLKIKNQPKDDNLERENETRDDDNLESQNRSNDDDNLESENQTNEDDNLESENQSKNDNCGSENQTKDNLERENGFKRKLTQENIDELHEVKEVTNTQNESTSIEDILVTKSVLNSNNAVVKNKDSPFEKHLSYPLPLQKNNGKKRREKIPSAISSDAWRKYYQDKLNEKEEKENAKRKRKAESINKKGNKKRVITKTDIKKNPQKCGECDDELESDTEIEAEKNIGCDICPRWYHLGCTQLSGLSYAEVCNLDFVCKLCLDA